MIRHICFSATNTTLRVMEALGGNANTLLNITLLQPDDNQLEFAAGDLVYVGFPVFGGRVPAVVLERLEALQGNGAGAVVVAVYGNRHYDDSIKEMQAFLEKRGFGVVATIAAVAQHSIAPTIATGRPDDHDIARLKEIGEEIEAGFASGSLAPMTPRPEEVYMEYRQLPVQPVSTPGCKVCGLCVAQCPAGAIFVDGGAVVTDASCCILCMRCVAVCPAHARKLPDGVLQAVTDRLNAKCPVAREIEIFMA